MNSSSLHQLVVDDSDREMIGRENHSSLCLSPGSELLHESSSLRINNLFVEEVINKEQRDILKAQVDVENTEVMHDLYLFSDEKVRMLADDLLFQTNSFTNIDGAGGSTWYALRTTGDSLESPKRPLSLRRQLSMKRNSWLGSAQDNRNHLVDDDGAETNVPSPSELKGPTPTPTAMKPPSRPKSSTKVFTAEDYFHRLKDKSKRMGTYHNPPAQDTNQSPELFRMKRSTDVPVYVVKKNRSKVESPPPSRTSLPINLPAKKDSAPSTDRTNSNDAPKKSGFLSGFTKLFKKKSLPPTATTTTTAAKTENENLVVNTSDDQFEFNQPQVASPLKEHVKRPLSVGIKSQPTESAKREECDTSSQSQIASPETEEERTSPQPASPGGDAPLWEVFSHGPSSPIFEGTNLNSTESRYPLAVTPSPSAEEVNQQKQQTVVEEVNQSRSNTGTSKSSPNPDTVEEKKLISQDFDEDAMEVWECYQVNEDTDSDSTLRERKVTWLFSNGGPTQLSRTYNNEVGCEKAHLPRLFGQVMNNPTDPSSAKKEYSKYYMKPLEIRTSAMKKGKVSTTAKVVKHVSYSSIEIRFFDYTIGQGVPSDGGPSLGLNWEFDSSLTLSSDLETFEEFRGGIVPDDADDDEEWNDNWRIPREYFLDAGGRLAKEVRVNLLKAAGHRRCSIDLSSFFGKQDMASRVKNSRSRAARLLIDGTDPDEVMVLQKEWEARQIIEPYLLQWIQKKKLK